MAQKGSEWKVITSIFVIVNRKNVTKRTFPAKFDVMIKHDFDIPRWWAPVKLFDYEHDLKEDEFKKDIVVKPNPVGISPFRLEKPMNIITNWRNLRVNRDSPLRSERKYS